jgi:hypothetical protein
MSADELRKAAETLRERVARLNPWDGSDDYATWAETYDEAAAEKRHGYPHTDHGFIATMHPGVGLALADWLEEVGAWIDEGVGLLPEGNIGDVWIAMRSHAKTVARLINGGAS